MKRFLSITVIVFIGVLAACGSVLAWQGRMAGMGDPFGLVEDESDFLIHPAKIANGDVTRFYGDYRFTYDRVDDWTHSRTLVTPSASFTFPMKASGDRFSNDALVGTALPFGPGRLGVFFQYDGTRGSFDGNEAESFGNFVDTFKLKNDFDQFSLKVLYGLPVCNFKLGMEAEVAYRTEENKTDLLLDQGRGDFVSFHDIFFGRIFTPDNILPYMLPYDSSFWETNLKASFTGNIAGAEVSLTGRGGFLFAGDNGLSFHSEFISPTGVVTPFQSADFHGDTNGWHSGGDLFVRVPLCPNLWLPILVRVDYTEKDKDGNAVGEPQDGLTYQDNESDLRIQAGAGLDRDLGGGARIAGGLYYNYIRTTSDFSYNIFSSTTGHLVHYENYIPYPHAEEHQIMARLVGEQQISASTTLRGGLTGFYGWLDENFDFSEASPVNAFFPRPSHIPLDGTHRGIEISLGATIKCAAYTLEPFVGGGYQEFDANGSENFTASTLLMDLSKNTAFVSAGFSIRY